MLTSEDTAADAYLASFCTQERINGYAYNKGYPDAYTPTEWRHCPPMSDVRSYPSSTATDSTIYSSSDRHPVSHLPPQHQFQQRWSIQSDADLPLISPTLSTRLEGLNLTKEQARLLIELKENQGKTFSPALDFADLSPPEAEMPLTPAFSNESSGSYFNFHSRANSSQLTSPIPPAVQISNPAPHMSPKNEKANGSRRQASNGMPLKRKAQTDHNAIEHRYRDKIRQQLEALKGLLPELHSDDACEKASKWIVLEHAVSRIKSLQTRNDELQGRNEELVERVDALENIISQLWASQQNSMQ
jgi:hypothetical protein